MSTFLLLLVGAIFGFLLCMGYTYIMQPPSNVSRRELLALQIIWNRGASRARQVVERSDGKLLDFTSHALLGNLVDRGLAVVAIDSGGAWYSVTTEGIQVCAINERLKGRNA